MDDNVTKKMEKMLRDLVLGCHARDGSNGIAQDFKRYQRALEAAENFLTKDLRKPKP